jgi:iron complex outermembrane receptor protein
LLLASIFVSLIVKAQEKEGELDDLFSLSLKQLSELKVDVASKQEETTADAPSSVTLITQQEIRNLGVQSVSEILDHVPGFMTAKRVGTGVGNTIYARGIGSDGILFLLNGQRLNDIYVGYSTIINKSIPVENIKQIEIVRGPGSSLYGSNAYVGVVNIVTFHDMNNVSLEMGNINTRRSTINISKKIGDLSFSAFLRTYADDGFEYDNITDSKGVTGSTRDPIEGIDFFSTLKYKSLSVDFSYLNVHAQDFLMWNCLGNNVNNENNSQFFINAKLNLKPSDKLKIDFSLAYLQDKWDAIFKALSEGAFGPNTAALIAGPYLESYHIDFNADVSYQLSENNSLITGIAFRNAATSDIKNQMNWNFLKFEYLGEVQYIPGYEFNKEKTRNVFGVYLQDKHRLGESLSFVYSSSVFAMSAPPTISA